MIGKWQIIIVPGMRNHAMALYPFILMKSEEYARDAELINHERIHFRQEIEMLFVFFYILYFLNYIVNRLKYKTHDAAYRNIVFEREAYTCAGDESYLKKRKYWAWLKYVRYTKAGELT